MKPINLNESWFHQRAFQLGDGHFTTIKIEQGQLVWWADHMNRLQEANKRLAFGDVEWSPLEYVCRSMAKPIQSGYLKVMISRGESVRGYQISAQMAPNVFVWAKSSDLPSYFSVKPAIEATELSTCLGTNPQTAGLKHISRIEQSLIQAELNYLSQAEGLVTDFDGRLIESSRGNVFWRIDGQWCTSALDKAGINGVFRQKLLASNANISIENRQLSDVLAQADALFVCNAITGPVPINKVHRITQGSAKIVASNLFPNSESSVEALFCSTLVSELQVS